MTLKHRPQWAAGASELLERIRARFEFSRTYDAEIDGFETAGASRPQPPGGKFRSSFSPQNRYGRYRARL